MKIYDFEGFPNPTRIRISLAEKESLIRSSLLKLMSQVVNIEKQNF